LRLDIPTLTELAMEVSNDPLCDYAQFALMASHVSEIVENNKDNQVVWVLAASLTYLLVENFQLEQRLLEK